MLEPGQGWVRVDSASLDALVEGSESVPPDLPEVEAALAAIREHVLRVEVAVADGTVLVQHCFWVGEHAMAVLLALDEERWQLTSAHPDFLGSLLVRATSTEPVRDPADGDDERALPASRLDDLLAAEPAVRSACLEHVGAAIAWNLTVDDGTRTTVVPAVQGSGGTYLYDTEQEVFRPVGNTQLFRIFSTVLPELAPR